MGSLFEERDGQGHTVSTASSQFLRERMKIVFLSVSKIVYSADKYMRSCSALIFRPLKVKNNVQGLLVKRTH